MVDVSEMSHDFRNNRSKSHFLKVLTTVFVNVRLLSEPVCERVLELSCVFHKLTTVGKT
jgi:hypothetical protein